MHIPARLTASVSLIAAFFVFTEAFGAASASGLKRAARVKPDHTVLHPGLLAGSLMLKFADDRGVYARSGHLYATDGRPVAAVENLITSGRVSGAASEFEWDKSTLKLWRERGESQAQSTLADLSQYFRLTLAPGTTPQSAGQLCDLLNRSADVELAFLEAKPEVAGDIAPATPDFEPQQDHLKAAPGGVDAYAAWTYPGGRGEGVTICDIEFGWQTTHEDLSKLPGHIIGGEYGTDQHGTAVMGEMVADSATSGLTSLGYGVTGISHGASARMVSVAPRSTADALLLAAANLSVGDLILIELHQPGPNSTGSGQQGYVPMEWTPSVFDAIQTITANGLIVCEAAGNGSENLSHSSYGGYFDTTQQYSGAIMCGAGAPPSGIFGPDRSRLSFSNYGMRVDLQGYGQGVVTTGYGGLFKDSLNSSDLDQHYTATFNGTSSASPIVTASVACIQGRFKNVSGGHTMTAKEIRDLLLATGSLQTGTTSQNIGRRPNLGAAMPLVAALSAYASPRTLNVSLLNTRLLTDTLWLVNPHSGPTLFDVSVVESLPVLPTRTVATPWDKAVLRNSPLSAPLAAVSNWLLLLPLSGSIPGGDSVPVQVTFDGNQLFGSYFGSFYKARLDVRVDGDAGIDTFPVPIMALAQDSIHGDTIHVSTPSVGHRLTSETNMSGWDYSDSLATGWLFDGSFVAGRVALGDTNVYRDFFPNAKRWRGKGLWQVDSSWWPNYLIWRDSTMSEDSVVGLAYEVWVPAAGDSTEVVLWRTSLYTRTIFVPNIRFGVVADWDLPGSSPATNLGGFDTTRQMIYQTGDAGFQNNAAGFALIRGKAFGGVVGSNPLDLYPNNGFTDERLYAQMAKPGFRVDPAAHDVDLHTLLTTAYDLLLSPGEVITSEIAVLSSRTGVAGLQAAWARARDLSDSLRYLTCPIVKTGDFNMDGILNSSDIILTVNFVFKNGPDPQPIELTADVNCSGQVTSADIINLVNHVFKSGPVPCDACTLY